MTTKLYYTNNNNTSSFDTTTNNNNNNPFTPSIMAHVCIFKGLSS